jgi:hypothetical protein
LGARFEVAHHIGLLQPVGVDGEARDTDVVLAAVDVLLDVGQAEDLVEPGDHGELFGFDGVHAGPVEERHHEFLDLAPVPLETLLRVDLLRPQVRRDLLSMGGEREVERVGQRMGRIGAHHQGPLPGGGRTHGGGSRDGRLPDPAFACEQQDAHHRKPTRPVRSLP